MAFREGSHSECCSFPQGVCVWWGGELDEHIILHRSGLAGQRGLGLQAGFFPLPFASFEFEYGT